MGHQSAAVRQSIGQFEPRSLRTYTPTGLVIARSAGVFHWTPEGRKLYDFTSGVLVANLGHNPTGWLKRFHNYLGWPAKESEESGYSQALPLSTYNAMTELEAEASRRLVDLLQGCLGGRRLEQIMWAASGSEAIQKALWAALSRDPARQMIIATRHGFHGKKGLAGATSGCESDPERDERVRFISFPMEECIDVSRRGQPFDFGSYERELDEIKQEYGTELAALITEPYLGGGGSYHPPVEYLHGLQSFCRENDILFILDEIQANFGRTRRMFAFETYGLEPDIVVLGKGLANGAPAAAAVGPAELFGILGYGAASDTYSANPLACAGVLATLDEFAERDLTTHVNRVSKIIEIGLVELKELPFVQYIRGENEGMVWGLETCAHDGKTAEEMANHVVSACHQGNGGIGIHLLGPLAGKVVRIAPPLTITDEQAKDAMKLMNQCLQ